MFGAATNTALAGTTVRATIGVAFHFDSGVQRFLRSTDSRIDPNGLEWRAGSTLANIDGLQFGIGRRTQPVTLTMAGLPAASLNSRVAEADVTGAGQTFFDLAKTQAVEVRGRKIEFFLHMFKADWTYVEAPVSLGVYLMDRLTPSFDGQNQVAGVKLACEPIGVSKFRAPNSYLDTRDQRARYPGDAALDFMPKYVVNQSLGAW